MIKEKPPKREFVSSDSPTSLELLRTDSNEAGLLKKKIDWFEATKREVVVMDRAWASFVLQQSDLLERIDRSEKELDEQAQHLESSKVCGLVYLKMLNEFEQKGISTDEIITFFQDALRVNSAYYDKIFSLHQGGTQIGYKPAAAARRRIWTQILDREQATIKSPSWFRGDNNEWKRFFALCADFGSYLHTEGSKVDVSKTEYMTFSGMYPDWFIDYKNQGKIPSREQVEQELKEDIEGQQGIYEQAGQINKRRDYLRQQHDKKLMSVREWGGSRIGSIKRGVSDFLTAVLYIDAYSGIEETRKPAAESIKGKYKIRPNKLVDDPEGEAAKYCCRRAEVYFSKESFALFIEKCLKDSEVIQSSKDPIDEKVMQIFTLLLDTRPTLDANQKEEWVKLKAIDKDTFKPLYYNLRPLVSAITEEDALSILIYLENNKGKPVENLIWDLASAMHDVSKSPPNTSHDQDWLRDLQKAVNQLGEVNLKWLRKNWRWYFDRLVSNFLYKASSDLPLVSQKETEVLPETQELLNETSKMKKGLLEGWRLVYIGNINDPFNSRYQTQIDGETLAEREEALARYTAENKVSLSIKPGSVIRALEGVVGSPSYVENVRITQTINGERFRKLKRRNMRIFYRIDPESKMILFHLYHKEDMSYRKLNK